MKVKYSEDELWPVRSIATDYSFVGELEISQELYDRWKKADDEWYAVQAILLDIADVQS